MSRENVEIVRRVYDAASRREGASVVHVRGGKVTRLVLYFSAERALGDLGLPWKAGSQRS